MSLFTVLLLLLILTAFVTHLPVRGQPLTTILHANQSITDSVPLYDSTALLNWFGPPSVVDYFDTVNTQQTAAVYAMQQLTSVNISGVSVCAVTANVSYYIQNATAVQEFLCCHAALLMQPALPAFMAQLNNYYLHTYIYGTEGQTTLDVVVNIERLRNIENASKHWRLCKNDTRIHIANTLSVRAMSIQKMLGVILHTYQLLQWASESLLTCLNYPTGVTGCATSTISSGLSPNFAFVDHNTFYQSRCGYAVLAYNEAYITNLTNCSA